MSKYSEYQLRLLDQLGFQEFDSHKDSHMVQNDIEIQEGERLFVEEHFNRKRIFIKIGDDDSYNGYEYTVYVLSDIGCETIRMPFNWSDIASDWLTHFKQSLCLHGFMKDGQEVKIDGI